MLTIKLILSAFLGLAFSCINHHAEASLQMNLSPRWNRINTTEVSYLSITGSADGCGDEAGSGNITGITIPCLRINGDTLGEIYSFPKKNLPLSVNFRNESPGIVIQFDANSIPRVGTECFIHVCFIGFLVWHCPLLVFHCIHCWSTALADDLLHFQLTVLGCTPVESNLFDIIRE